MKYGLYVGHQKQPRVTSMEWNVVHELVNTLTPAEREQGWTICPIAPEWPQQQDHADPANHKWLAVGMGLIVFLGFILAMTFKP